MASENVKELPLQGKHEALGARFAPFAGYRMPMRYSSILEEHAAVRENAGLFDVSHMGEVFVRGPGAVSAVDRIITNHLAAIDEGRALYTVMCRPDGGIVDDLIVYRLGEEEVLLCVNASNREKDYRWISEQVGDAAEVVDESDEWVQLALQGPSAEAILDPLTDHDLAELPGFRAVWADVGGVRTLVARTGYTGEDGFELYVPADGAEAVFDAVWNAGNDHELAAAGLGARDTLRLEARLLLYGNDIDESTNPIEAGLGWVVKWDKGEFVGRDALQRVRENGPTRRLRGLILQDRGMIRAGYGVWDGDQRVGETTSGSVAPSLDGASIGLAYVDVRHANAETLDVDIRGRRVPAQVTKKPFYRRDS